MPSPRRVFSLRLPPSVRARLEEIAERNGMSLNRAVTLVLIDKFGMSKSVARSRATRDREPMLEARAFPGRAAVGGSGGVPRSGEPSGSAVGRSVQTYKAGRNAPCPCGSGEKFKRCHGRSAAL